MAEKKTIKIKLMLRTIVWYFSNGWLFLPFTLLQVNYADMVHAWYRENGFYHWTYHSCSSNTIHYYHGGRGGVGTIVHILAHITGKLVCIFPVTPDTVFFFYQNSGSNLDWNEKEPIHNRGDSLYIEITCACSIGNKVLVIGNTNVRFYSLWWQDSGTASSSPCRPLTSWSCPWARRQRGVAVRHGSASSSLNPFNLEHQERNATLVRDRCLRATLVYSGWVGGGRGCRGGGGRGVLGAFLSSSMNEWDRRSHSIRFTCTDTVPVSTAPQY